MPKGRPKGSGNKKPAGEAFVARVESLLIKADSKLAPFALENLACRFLTQSAPNIGLPVWQKLMEYKFGKPLQPTEITGKDGGEISVKVTHVGN